VIIYEIIVRLLVIVHSNCDYMFRLIWVIVGSIPDCSQFSDLLNVTNFKYFFFVKLNGKVVPVA